MCAVRVLCDDGVFLVYPGRFNVFMILKLMKFVIKEFIEQIGGKCTMQLIIV